MSNNNILILDDEQIVIDAVKKHLKNCDYKVYSAQNGSEGLQLYNRIKPILIILDLKMPVMDGFEFLETLKLSPSDPCSVIVLTGHGSDEDMERCFELGVSAFLHKPFSVYELRGMVKHSIALRQVEKDLKRELDKRTKIEHELMKYKLTLEDLVEKRTSELQIANEKLQREIAEKTSAQEKLKHSLSEKEVLLREIHHRVKNNLQIISSLLDLQAKGIKEPGTLAMFKDSQSRLKTMALIHEKLYQSEDMVKIDFPQYLSNLLNHLYHSYCLNLNEIRITSELEDVHIGVDTAIPCGLIINELISNSFKHAFAPGDTGEIKVVLKETPQGRFNLTVSDNGRSFQEKVDISKAKSLGLRLVYALAVDQLEGTIQYDSSHGTTFRISFEEVKYKKRGL